MAPTEDTWTVSSTLTWTEGYLSRKGDENAKSSARWLLSAATGLSRMELFTNYDKPLSKDELSELRGMIQRRAAGEPVQYITGKSPFRTIEVNVGAGVLIPRPETEVLVGEALAYVPKDEDSLVLDLCCGSGCIACAVATERPKAQVLAADISPVAVEITQKNVNDLSLQDRVQVFEGDLLEAVPKEFHGFVDVIVTNPPYIPTTVCETLPAEVGEFEPRLALDGGEDGLDIFRAILAGSQDILAPGGVLAAELHETCLEAAQELAEASGLTDVRIVEDLVGKPRVLVAHLSFAEAE